MRAVDGLRYAIIHRGKLLTGVKNRNNEENTEHGLSAATLSPKLRASCIQVGIEYNSIVYIMHDISRNACCWKLNIGVKLAKNL